MRTFIFAMIAIIGLGASVGNAFAQSYAHEAPIAGSHRMHD